MFSISLLNYFEVLDNTTVQIKGQLVLYCKCFILQVYKYLGRQDRLYPSQKYSNIDSLNNQT